MNREELYRHMSEFVEKKNLLQSFANDLHVHDYNNLAEMQHKPFIWVARTCGTHMYRLGEGLMPKEDAKGWVRFLARTFTGDEKWYALYDGNKWAEAATDDPESFLVTLSNYFETL